MSVRKKASSQADQGSPRASGKKPQATQAAEAPCESDTTISSPVDKPDGFPIVGIGASAGGLDALKEFFAVMPPDSGMAFLVIQHLDPAHESYMAEILDKVTEMDVLPAGDRMPVSPNTVYTIPPNKALAVRDDVLYLSEPVKHDGIRLPIDFLFENLAQDQGERAIGIVLSGTGSDGTMGLRAIRGAGGMVIAQDPTTAQFDGMPRSAIDTGLADLVLPVAQMPAALTGYARHAYLKGRAQAEGSEDDVPDELQAILGLLARKTRTDFRWYKKHTLRRRIERRMGLRQIPTMGEYLRLLTTNPDELTLLGKDMLIGVTRFFRDPELFEELRQQVIVPMVRRKIPGTAIRVWVPGCATGEEAYTIAMLFLEELEDARKSCILHVFASDVDEQSLERARAGIYPENIGAEVSPARLEQYFTKLEHGYQVNKQLRESVVFARHNLVSDAPFSKLDMVSCRNLLIYLETEIQKKVISLFAFAIAPGGFLFLGKSESVIGQTDLFEVIARKARIYRRSIVAHVGAVYFPVVHIKKSPVSESAAPFSETRASPLTNAELNQSVLLKHFRACVVLTDPKGEILYLYGDAGKYLDYPTGEAALSIFKLARERLAAKLRQGLHEATRTGGEVRMERVAYRHDDPTALINVTIGPAITRRKAARIFSIIIEDAPVRDASDKHVAPRTATDGYEPLEKQLSSELEASREELRSAIEELDAANEEHKAVNEEITSMNEELQSANEELETSKEEIQSVNEELTTVNAQLTEKVRELGTANNDLANLFTATDIATIFLDLELRVKRFTPSATKLLNLMQVDVGRPVAHISQNFNEGLVADAERVLRELATIEKEVQTRDGRWYMMRALPYRTLDNRIEGVVVTFADVTRLKETEATLREAKLFAESIIATIREPLLVLDMKLCVQLANAAFYQLFQTTPAETEGQSIYQLGSKQWNVGALRHVLEEVIPEHSQVEDYELSYELPDQAWRTMLLNARRIRRGDDKPELILLAIEDITARKEAQERLLSADRQKDEFLAMLAHELRNPLAPIRSANEIISLTASEDPNLLKQCALIGRQVGHMSRLLDDLLDISRITRGKISLQDSQFDLRDVLDQAIESTHELFVKRQQELNYVRPAEPIWIRGDFTRLVQVIYNLLLNANKYTETDGHVWIDAAQLPLPDSLHQAEAVVRIKDTGIGIAPDVLDHVFDLFSQATMTPDRSQGGLGIGLTLVKSITQMHGGSVQAFSQGIGKGSEFTIRLPALQDPAAVAKLAHTVAAAKPKPQLPDAQRRVLIVEDNADSAHALGELLEIWGHQVEVALDGRSAIEIALTFRPEVVLLDIGLPGIDGYEVAQHLRNEPSLKKLSLVALTGYGQEEDRRRSEDAGFDIHLTKPVDLTELRTLLNNPPSAPRKR